jgi:hypothetical protein
VQFVFGFRGWSVGSAAVAFAGIVEVDVYGRFACEPDTASRIIIARLDVYCPTQAQIDLLFLNVGKRAKSVLTGLGRRKRKLCVSDGQEKATVANIAGDAQRTRRSAIVDFACLRERSDFVFHGASEFPKPFIGVERRGQPAAISSSVIWCVTFAEAQACAASHLNAGGFRFR